VKVEPRPSSLWHSMVPPCAATRLCEIARPRPVPPTSRERALSTR